MIRILVIEDERMFRESLVRRIRKFPDCEVVAEAANGFEGLMEVAQTQPDAIFSDIRMPGMDGIVFLEQLRKDYGRTPVVYISGYQNFEQVRRALQLGALDYVTKPLEDQELERVIAKIREQQAGQEPYDAPDAASETEGPANWNEMIRQWIKQHLREASLHGAAEHANMNAAAFSRKFSAQIGVTFTQYLTRLRLERAKELLAEPNRKIQDIPAEVGLFDPRYFSEMFKKHVGCTPQEYRRRGER